MRCRAIAVALATLGLGACANMPDLAAMQGEAISASPRDQVRAAIEFLDAGDARHARAELRSALRAQPGNATALSLMEQLDGDPRQLLGSNARPYTVRAGETMSQIAERQLGNGLLFYALARYNGMEAPNALAAGQVIMVPRRTNNARVAAVAPVETPIGAPTAPLRASETARANQMRLQGLQQLNGGQVDAAVASLRQAQALDAANIAIQRDLDRAVRLQASLRARR